MSSIKPPAGGGTRRVDENLQKIPKISRENLWTLKIATNKIGAVAKTIFTFVLFIHLFRMCFCLPFASCVFLKVFFRGDKWVRNLLLRSFRGLLLDS